MEIAWEDFILEEPAASLVQPARKASTASRLSKTSGDSTVLFTKVEGEVRVEEQGKDNTETADLEAKDDVPVKQLIDTDSKPLDSDKK